MNFSEACCGSASPLNLQLKSNSKSCAASVHNKIQKYSSPLFPTPCTEPEQYKVSSSRFDKAQQRSDRTNQHFAATNAIPIVQLYVLNKANQHPIKVKENSTLKWVCSSTTGPEGYRFFRGKPPLRPYTRLGCYRAQTAKSKQSTSNIGRANKTTNSSTSTTNRLALRDSSAGIPKIYKRSTSVPTF